MAQVDAVAAPTGLPPIASAPAWLPALRLSTTRAIALGAAAAALAIVHAVDPHRRLVVCPWRALTGIPCPFCGGTTAAVSLAHVDLRAALAASPLAILGGLVFVGAPLAPLLRVRRPRLWVPGVLAALALSELWQLVRLSVVRL